MSSLDEMLQIYDLERQALMLNPPIVVSPELGKVVKAQIWGKPVRIKSDNRYTVANVQIVDGILRGNSKTVSVERLELK